jgi:hypothetical protein
MADFLQAIAENKADGYAIRQQKMLPASTNQSPKALRHQPSSGPQ